MFLLFCSCEVKTLFKQHGRLNDTLCRNKVFEGTLHPGTTQHAPPFYPCKEKASQLYSI